MKKLLNILIVVIALLLAVSCGQVQLPGGRSGEGDGAVSWAGIRVSSYGMKDSYREGENLNFPDTTKMANLAETMSSYYEDSIPTYILIVGTMSGDDSCQLEFPVSDDESFDYVYGRKSDKYEEYLDKFDEIGAAVWLQVEPGNADLVKLAKLVLNRYKHHKCVKGFGIDVEWYYPKGTNGYGKKLESSVANKVLSAVRAIDSNYTVFVKHWDERWLPNATDGFIYVNDSQNYLDLDDDISRDEVNALVNSISKSDARKAAENMRDDFSDWAAHFAPCPVMFQIGYQKDKPIWKKLFNNPAKEMGDYLAKGCNSGNKIGIIWVDFTLKEVLF